MLCAVGAWPLAGPDLQRLWRIGRAMVGQICNVKPEGVPTVRSDELLARLRIDDLDVVLGKGFAGLDTLVIRWRSRDKWEKLGPGRPRRRL